MVVVVVVVVVVIDGGILFFMVVVVVVVVVAVVTMPCSLQRENKLPVYVSETAASCFSRSFITMVILSTWQRHSKFASLFSLFIQCWKTQFILFNNKWMGLLYTPIGNELLHQTTVKSCIKARTYVQFSTFWCGFYSSAAFIWGRLICKVPIICKTDKAVWHM